MSESPKRGSVSAIRSAINVMGAAGLALLGSAIGVAATIQAPPGGLADLTASLTQLTSSPVTSFTDASYTLTVRNGGAAAAANVQVRVSFSGPDWGAPGAGSVGDGCTFSSSRGAPDATVFCTGINLSPGATKAVTIHVRAATFADSSPVKTFRITTVVDPNNSIPESNEANNSAQVATLIVKRPDLVADATGLPLTSAGLELTYPIKVRNTGDGSAANVITRIHLPREVGFVRADASQLGACVLSGTAGDRGVVTCTLASMPGNSDASVRIVTRPIQGLLDGARIISFFVVDPDHLVAERSEENNVAEVTTTVSVTADLEITTVTIERHHPTPLRPTGSVPINAVSCAADGFESHANTTVRVRIANRGPAQSSPTVLHVVWTSSVLPSFFSDCPAGTRCNQGNCQRGAVSPDPYCLDNCSVTGLRPGETVEVVFQVIRINAFDNLGVATVDPQRAVNDPNRANNVKHIIG